jgi:ParB-like chromosome segregation protein Spo0J
MGDNKPHGIAASVRLTTEEVLNSGDVGVIPVPDAPPSKGTELSSQLVSIPLAALDSNPYRDLATYPFSELKINALKRSIGDVGLWEGVIARKVADRYQTAFGHHRIEAAKQSGLTEATIILRDLDDKAMLQFMGRENMADYNADFITMLQTWDAAVSYFPSRDGKRDQPIEIATLLGWTQLRKPASVQMNRTAEACNSTHKLLHDGFLKREDLTDLTVNQVREICVRAQADVDRIVKKAKETKRPVAQVEAAKKQIAKAVVQTAKESRRGQVAQKDLRSRVGMNAYRYDRAAKKPTPVLAVYTQQVKSNINSMLDGDATETKLGHITEALVSITLAADILAISQLQGALGLLISRAAKWRTRLSIDSQKPAEVARRGEEE